MSFKASAKEVGMEIVIVAGFFLGGYIAGRIVRGG